MGCGGGSWACPCLEEGLAGAQWSRWRASGWGVAGGCGGAARHGEGLQAALLAVLDQRQGEGLAPRGQRQGGLVAAAAGDEERRRPWGGEGRR